jgi:hypothetical protein
MQYVEEMGVLDHQAMFSNERDKLEKKLVENKNKQKIDRAVIEEIIEAFRHWYETFLKEWDRTLEDWIVEAIKVDTRRNYNWNWEYIISVTNKYQRLHKTYSNLERKLCH